MNEMTEKLSRLLMEFLQRVARGKENAVTRDQALRYLKMFDRELGDRGLRNLYSRLPVCSSEKGLFIPVNPEEVEAFRSYLKAKAMPMLERYKIILAFYPALAPKHGEQGNLFGEPCA